MRKLTLWLLILLAACTATPSPPRRVPISALQGEPPEVPTLPTMPASPPLTRTDALPATAAATAAAPRLTPTARAEFTYTVQPGDTLTELAVRFGVPVAAIQLRNDMGDETTLRAGQTLVIPSPQGWEGSSPFWVVYIVREGETLSEIAAAYGLDLAHLVALNNLTSADYVVAGQTLILPLNVPLDIAAHRPQRRPTPTPTRPPRPTARPSTPTATSRSTTPAAPAGPAPEVSAWPREIWRLMNEVRTAHGLPPYAYSETLARAAQLHAEDCLQRGYCSHTGSDGSNVKTRILRAGYDPLTWAECWALQPSPQGAIDIWMDEEPPNDPHRRTLLHTVFTEVGIGVAMTDWGYAYIIADFGKPK